MDDRHRKSLHQRFLASSKPPWPRFTIPASPISVDWQQMKQLMISRYASTFLVRRVWHQLASLNATAAALSSFSASPANGRPSMAKKKKDNHIRYGPRCYAGGQHTPDTTHLPICASLCLSSKRSLFLSDFSKLGFYSYRLCTEKVRVEDWPPVYVQDLFSFYGRPANESPPFTRTVVLRGEVREKRCNGKGLRSLALVPGSGPWLSAWSI